MSKNLLTLETGLAVSLFVHGASIIDACDNSCRDCNEFKQIMGQAHTIAAERNIVMNFTKTPQKNSRIESFQAFCDHCQDGVNDSRQQCILWSRLHLSKAHGMNFNITKK